MEASGLKEECTETNEVVKNKEEDIAIIKSEVSGKDQSLTSLKQRCSSLQTQLETAQRKILFLEVSGLILFSGRSAGAEDGPE